MKKTLFFLLLLGMSGTAFSQVLLNDNFNSYTVGNLSNQGGWILYGGSAAQANIAEVTAATYGKSVQCVRTTTADMWVGKSVSGWTTRTSGNDILEAKFDFHSGSGSAGQSVFQLVANSANTQMGSVKYDHVAKELSYYSAGTTSTLFPIVGNLADNTWYNISLYYNYTNGQTKISVNGTDYGPYTAAANQNFSKLYMYTSGGNLTSSWDNISLNAVNTVLETKEIIAKSNLKVYPNPISDIVNIASDKKISNISINDLSGKKLLESNETKLNIKSFSKGVYLLTVKYVDGITETKKIIKN